MDSSEVSLIRPVSGLQKTTRVAKTGPREERRRKPNRDPKGHEPSDTDVPVETEADVSPAAHSVDDPHSIDFRA